MVIYSKGSFDEKKRGRPPAPNVHHLNPGDMFLLSWNSLHRIVAMGDEEIEWLQISAANCTEYLMHNDYLEKKPSKDKKRKRSTETETEDETEDESTGLSISDNSVEVK